LVGGVWSEPCNQIGSGDVIELDTLRARGQESLRALLSVDLDLAVTAAQIKVREADPQLRKATLRRVRDRLRSIRRFVERVEDLEQRKEFIILVASLEVELEAIDHERKQRRAAPLGNSRRAGGFSPDIRCWSGPDTTFAEQK
jgi:hypothetical protein